MLSPLSSLTFSVGSLHDYRTARCRGESPLTIQRTRRASPPPLPLEWRTHGIGSDVARAVATVDGFTVTASILYSNDAPEDEYGRFTSRPGDDGAIDRRRFGKVARGEHRYYIPPYSEAEHREVNRKYRGLGKHAADCEARAWVARMHRLAASGDVSAYDLRVDVAKGGVKLATAWLGLGADDGSGTAAGRAYGWTWEAQDVIREAVAEARETLAGLCDCAAK